MDLFEAAETGNEEELQKLIKESHVHENNDKNSGRNTPPEMLASDSYATNTQTQHEEETSLNLQDQEGDTALHIAAIHGQTESVKVLIQAGADPNIQNRWGDTPLYIAALNGHIGSIAALVQAGADHDIQNCWGNTPLYIAAWNNHPESIEVLVQAGANKNIQNKKGWAALHCASIKGATKCVKALLDAGADTMLMNQASKTPEDLAENETVKNQFREHRIAHENKTLTQNANAGQTRKSTAAVHV